MSDSMLNQGESLDKMWSIRDGLERASLLLGEVAIEYFQKFDQEKEADHLKILWNFQRNAIFVGIIDDYVLQAKKAIEELTDMADEELFTTKNTRCNE